MKSILFVANFRAIDKEKPIFFQKISVFENFSFRFSVFHFKIPFWEARAFAYCVLPELSAFILISLCESLGSFANHYIYAFVANHRLQRGIIAYSESLWRLFSLLSYIVNARKSITSLFIAWLAHLRPVLRNLQLQEFFHKPKLPKLFPKTILPFDFDIFYCYFLFIYKAWECFSLSTHFPVNSDFS